MQKSTKRREKLAISSLLMYSGEGVGGDNRELFGLPVSL